MVVFRQIGTRRIVVETKRGCDQKQKLTKRETHIGFPWNNSQNDDGNNDPTRKSVYGGSRNGLLHECISLLEK